jgi:hypothetical protein
VRRGVIMLKQLYLFSTSSGRGLRTFSCILRKTSQWNPEFTGWPVGTGASRYLNCCIDRGTSPEYFGYHPVHTTEIAYFVTEGDALRGTRTGQSVSWHDTDRPARVSNVGRDQRCS